MKKNNINSIYFSLVVHQIVKLDEKLTELHDSKTKTYTNDVRANKSILYFMEEKNLLIEELDKILDKLNYETVIKSKEIK